MLCLTGRGVTLGGIFLPSVAEDRFAGEERIHGEFVTAGSERVLQNIILVDAEVSDNLFFGMFERLRIDRV